MTEEALACLKGQIVHTPEDGKRRDLAIRSAPREAGAVVEGRDLVRSAAAREIEEAADAVAERSVAEKTRRSSKSDWESWEAFCGAHGFTPLPADPEQVRLYLTQLTQFAGRK